MPESLEEKDWATLLRRIKSGKCTPFLGAGACFGTLPLGSHIAQKWATDYGYPLKDCDDLARVAQFLAVQHDPMFPKEEFLSQFIEKVDPPDFTERGEPHGVLAGLPLPVYMTTNYDDFMFQALLRQDKDPKQEMCQWNEYVRGHPSVFDTHFEPTPTSPIVFHLHGHRRVPESLVLTEDDYLNFLVNIARDGDLLPFRIQRSLAGASLLFVGYRLADWSFRVLFRGFVSSMEDSLRRISVAVQLLPEDDNVRRYLSDYFGNINVKVYWGTAREFASELWQRWEEFSHGN